MSTETPWVFALKVGDKIKPKPEAYAGKDEEKHTWIVKEVSAYVNISPVDSDWWIKTVWFPRLYSDWEPAPPAPVYVRPDLSDWDCAVNPANQVEAIFRYPSEAKNYTRTSHGWKVVPYSATTPATEPEPMVPVAKVREWIERFREIGFTHAAIQAHVFLTNYLAEKS